MKKFAASAVLLTAAALALSGCGTAPETTPSTSDTNSASASASSAPTTSSKFLACMVSDQGGFNDNSFNQSGFEGMEKAQSELGIDIKSAESQSASDFTPNLKSMVSQNCDLTFTVGYMLADATKAQATATPNMNFAIIDDNSIDLPNVKSLVFKTSDAAFLAGYLAASYTQSGIVATFGGMAIPTVTIFMDGFVDGVAQYNADNSKTVQVLGWDKASQNGSFTGDFDDQSKGQNTTKNFIDQGADVVMPVAGPVGLGAAAAAQEAGNVAIVWVDADGYETAPQYQDLFLTSVVKEIGASVYDTIEQAESGSYSNAEYIGTLANGGVGLAPYHNFDSKIPDDIKTKITDLASQISSGTLKVTSISDPQQ